MPHAKPPACSIAFLAGCPSSRKVKSRLIRVGFTSTSPAKAALVANKMVDEYIKSQKWKTKSEGAAARCGMA